ncbi:hypothetical protein BTM25_33080 [Actinomadura rubteroloni]|uniref:DUF397 domain-containing protein n=1 Tax=Actinomadura rubteroloni TaxID=1926885 RepID=A0A2P4UHY4_9ACTN|nr:DUF397 domain-containing protein [Actinomadura rubteroloni]POM24674.1 hypothetical protein BTM25_33080 [Actinomadura rubteroloni]
MRNGDLYTLDISGATWTKPCGGNVGDPDAPESCMEFATLPDGAIAIRDSKRPDLTPMRFSADELTAFLGAI